MFKRSKYPKFDLLQAYNDAAFRRLIKNTTRNVAIYAAVDSGETLVAAGKLRGLTKERARQIVNHVKAVGEKELCSVLMLQTADWNTPLLISNLSLNRRCVRGLIEKFGEFVSMATLNGVDMSEYLKIRNFGEKSYNEVSHLINDFQNGVYGTKSR